MKVSKTRLGKRLWLPEFETSVPTILPDFRSPRAQDMLKEYIGYGASRAVAEKLAAESCQMIFEGGWRRLLKMALVKDAEVFQALHGSLDGFDPAEAARVWLPAKDRFLRGRKDVRHRRFLWEMGQ